MPLRIMGGRGACLGVILLLYAVAYVLAGPSGDFPLNDDWSYAATVRRFVSTGDWRPEFWANMSLISQSLWAAPFCLADHCSYDALRASSFTATAICIAATYVLVSKSGCQRAMAALAALLVAFDPLLFSLSLSFMTDVVFTSLLTLSFLGFVSYINTERTSHLVLGCAAALAATLCRQFALCVPIAFMLATLTLTRPGLRPFLLSSMPLLVCLGGLLVFEHWMNVTGRTPGLYYDKSNHLLQLLRQPGKIAGNLARNASEFAFYLTLFALPLILCVRPAPTTALPRGRPSSGAAGVWAFSALLVALAVLAFGRLPYPINGNYLVDAGLGPLTVRDVHLLHLPNYPPLPGWAWWTVTLVVAAGLVLTLRILAGEIAAPRGRVADEMARRRRTGLTFGLLTILVYFVPMGPDNVFDRYVAAVLPIYLFCWGTILAGGEGRTAAVPTIAWGVAGLMALFSVAASHDYMSWNRARWRVLDDLQARYGASATDTDGGFEYNGAAFAAHSHDVTAGKSWWWVEDDLFMVAFGPVPGYEIVAQKSFMRWLVPGKTYLYGLRRLGGPAAPSASPPSSG